MDCKEHTDSEVNQAMGASMKQEHRFKKTVPMVGLSTVYNFAYRMRFVQRLSGFHTIAPYTDAEHCYYTALLFIAIAKEENLKPTQEQTEWVMCHDIVEVITGDLLNPAKRGSKEAEDAWDVIEYSASSSYPQLVAFTDTLGKRLLAELWPLFRDCDSLELYNRCIWEEERGNVLVNPDGTKVKECMHQILIKSQYKTVRELAFHGA